MHIPLILAIKGERYLVSELEIVKQNIIVIPYMCKYLKLFMKFLFIKKYDLFLTLNKKV